MRCHSPILCSRKEPRGNDFPSGLKDVANVSTPIRKGAVSDVEARRMDDDGEVVSNIAVLVYRRRNLREDPPEFSTAPVEPV